MAYVLHYYTHDGYVVKAEKLRNLGTSYVGPFADS